MRMGCGQRPSKTGIIIIFATILWLHVLMLRRFASPSTHTSSFDITDHNNWKICTEPKNVVAFNFGLFITLIMASCLQALLCVSQMINGLVGCLCGPSNWEVQDKDVTFGWSTSSKCPSSFALLCLSLLPFLTHRKCSFLLMRPHLIIYNCAPPEVVPGATREEAQCSLVCIKLLLWWCCLW